MNPFFKVLNTCVIPKFYTTQFELLSCNWCNEAIFFSKWWKYESFPNFRLLNLSSLLASNEAIFSSKCWTHVLFPNVRLLNLSCFPGSNEGIILLKWWARVLFPNFRLLNLSYYLHAMRPSFFKVMEIMCHSQILGYSIWAVFLVAMRSSFFFKVMGTCVVPRF